MKNFLLDYRRMCKAVGEGSRSKTTEDNLPYFYNVAR